jgi:hypothetical protein
MPHNRTLIPAETKVLLAAQMQAIAMSHGNLSEAARQLSRAWLVRPDTINTNWRRWLKEKL